MPCSRVPRTVQSEPLSHSLSEFEQLVRGRNPFIAAVLEEAPGL
jgi:hypothetical protein